MPGPWKEIDGDGEEEIKQEKLGLLPSQIPGPLGLHAIV